MNWNHLPYILTIAEHRNITHAAEELFLSQPSLSLSLKGLEQELGVPLFERRQGGLELTYAGALFCEWAQSVLHSHRQLMQKLGDISNNQRRLIQLGVSPHRSPILIPTILKKFYQRCPDCELHVVEKPTYELKELLEQGNLDLIIDMAHPDTVNYQNDLLVEEKVILAVPMEYVRQLPEDVQHQKTLSLQMLSDFPFVLLSADHVIGRICRRMCEAAVFQPDVRLTCSGVESALRLTSQQLGITFVPEIFAAQRRFASDVCYYEVEDFQSTRQVCLVYSKNLYRHQPLQTLMQLFREMTPSIYQGCDMEY